MTNITNEQLEAWAGLGPWHVGRSLCGYYPAITKDIHAGHNTNITGAVHGYMYHADQKADQANNAALIAAAPALAAALLVERKAREVEVGKLRAAIQDIAENWEWWNEDRHDRCSSVVGDSIADAEQALKGGERS